MDSELNELKQKQINEEYSSLVSEIESTWKESEKEGLDLAKQAALKITQLPESEREISTHDAYPGIIIETVGQDEKNFIHILYDNSSTEGKKNTIRIDEKDNIFGVLAIIKADAKDIDILFKDYDANRFLSYGKDVLHVGIMEGKIHLVQREIADNNKGSIAVQNLDGELVFIKVGSEKRTPGAKMEFMRLILNKEKGRIEAKEYVEANCLKGICKKVSRITTYIKAEAGNAKKDEEISIIDEISRINSKKHLHSNNRYALEMIKLGVKTLGRSLLEKAKGKTIGRI